MPPVEPVLRHLEQDFDQAVERYLALLRIPSVSTDPAYKQETRRAGQTLSDELATLGFETSLRDTPGHPVVVAHHPGPGGAKSDNGGPHLLYYGHYDVQPPDPLDLWDSPPFQPVIVEANRGPRVVARGAVDDKGQVRTFMEAFRGWHAVHGTLPVKITVLLEGEEETGSPSLPPFLDKHREELSAPDVAIVTDTNSWDIDTPAVTYMLRGLVYVEVTLHGPSRDLHSGLYGGAVVNPINALTRVLAQLHDQNGRVQIPGFYDDVAEPAPEEAQAWRRLGFDEKAFLGEIGLACSTGEGGRSLLERIWARPTCDLNGIWGGYTGVGAKTVIAAKASAKLSCRLVAHQDPARIIEGIKRFLDCRTPPGCRWEIQAKDGSPGIRVATDSRFMEAVRAGLKDIYHRDAVLIGMGGSIPVVGWMQHQLGLDSILVGFGLDDDRIHSPNEKFELRCLRNGIMSHAAILGHMAALRAA
ncbi:MAG TPA: M20/M25/M40 family metallo-hydrolase [Stellaceae bacterium]|nr:M20/M25/M40 family metallo-hydrolase [Stellaceae bacterium]